MMMSLKGSLAALEKEVAPAVLRLADLFWEKLVPAASEAAATLLPRLERAAWECFECVPVLPLLLLGG